MKTKPSANTTMLHLRMDKSLLTQVKKVAKAMGVSVSLIGETLFKEFLEEKRLVIKADFKPGTKLRKILDEAEKNKDNSKYWSSHSSVKDLMDSLRK